MSATVGVMVGAPVGDVDGAFCWTFGVPEVRLVTLLGLLWCDCSLGWCRRRCFVGLPVGVMVVQLVDAMEVRLASVSLCVHVGVVLGVVRVDLLVNTLCDC